MAEQLAHRDLRNRSSEVLREVAAGATYEVTNHGEVVAILSPPGQGVAPRCRPARVRGGFAGLARDTSNEPTSEALDALREER